MCESEKKYIFAKKLTNKIIDMKRVFLMIALMWGCMGIASAQQPLNDNGDNILGTYASKQGESNFKAKITKLEDGTYQAQVIWLDPSTDAKGNKLLDAKNPDESLRNTPADQIVLFSGLKYNAKKHRWDGTKIYDPQRGMRAKMTAEFDKEGRLIITGSVLLISESVTWEKIEE
jgi:uncharacterized protein (DUF2147 family)